VPTTACCIQQTRGTLVSEWVTATRYVQLGTSVSINQSHTNHYAYDRWLVAVQTSSSSHIIVPNADLDKSYRRLWTKVCWLHPRNTGPHAVEASNSGLVGSRYENLAWIYCSARVLCQIGRAQSWIAERPAKQPTALIAVLNSWISPKSLHPESSCETKACGSRCDGATSVLRFLYLYLCFLLVETFLHPSQAPAALIRLSRYFAKTVISFIR